LGGGGDFGGFLGAWVYKKFFFWGCGGGWGGGGEEKFLGGGGGISESSEGSAVSETFDFPGTCFLKLWYRYHY